MFDTRYIKTFLTDKPEMYREDFLYFKEKIERFGYLYNENNSNIIDKIHKPIFAQRVIGVLKSKHYIQIFGIYKGMFFTKNYANSNYVKILREYNLNKLLKY